jgi:DnaJ-class molecular chaperone
VIDEKNKCRTCNGRRTVQEQKILEVVIAPGMRENQKIVFHSEGDQEVVCFNPLFFERHFK